MPIKLYDPKSPFVEQISANQNRVDATWLYPTAPANPYADSEARIRVTHEEFPARLPGSPYMWSTGYVADPRPPAISDAEGTMQVAPKGFETEWRKGKSDAPFLLTR